MRWKQNGDRLSPRTICLSTMSASLEQMSAAPPHSSKTACKIMGITGGWLFATTHMTASLRTKNKKPDLSSAFFRARFSLNLLTCQRPNFNDSSIGNTTPQSEKCNFNQQQFSLDFYSCHETNPLHHFTSYRKKRRHNNQIQLQPASRSPFFPSSLEDNLLPRNVTPTSTYSFGRHNNPQRRTVATKPTYRTMDNKNWETRCLSDNYYIMSYYTMIRQSTIERMGNENCDCTWACPHGNNIFVGADGSITTIRIRRIRISRIN